MPEAVQGASSRMASKGRPSHQAASAGIGRDALRLQAQPLQVLVDALGSAPGPRPAPVTSASASSSRCAVLPPGAAQASSTRSGAPGRAASPQQQRRASWAPASCTDSIAVREARDRVHRQRLRQDQRRRRPPLAAMPLRASAQHLRPTDPAAYSPAASWAPAVVGRQDRLPLARDGPAAAARSTSADGSTRDRVGVGGRDQRVALAQEAAQAGVDEACCARVSGARLAASTAWSTSVKGVYGRALFLPRQRQRRAQQRVGGGGGGRLASWRRSASARPEVAQDVEGASACIARSKATRTNAWAVSCNWRQSGGEREDSERSDKRWMVTTASVDAAGVKGAWIGRGVRSVRPPVSVASPMPPARPGSDRPPRCTGGPPG
jgi:hypothetical protein